MILSLSNKDFNELISKVSIETWTHGENTYELELEDFGNSWVPNIDGYKKVFLLNDELSDFKYPMSQSDQREDESSAFYQDAFGIDIVQTNGQCEKCHFEKLRLPLWGRAKVDLDNINFKLRCLQCSHAAGECNCIYCRNEGKNNSTVRELVYLGNDFEKVLNVLLVLFSHYESIRNFYNNIESWYLENDLDPNSLVIDLVSSEGTLKLAQERSFRFIDIELKKLLDRKLLRFKEISFRDFFHEYTDMYTFPENYLNSIQKTIKEEGVEFIPSIFINNVEYSPEVFALAKSSLDEDGVALKLTGRKYLDDDILEFTNLFASRVHGIDLDLKSATHENIIKILKVLPEMSVFKAIESSINGAINYSKREELGKYQYRNMIVKFLNICHTKYDPSSAQPFVVNTPITEWELEDKWGIRSNIEIAKESLESLKKIDKEYGIHNYFSNLT